MRTTTRLRLHTIILSFWLVSLPAGALGREIDMRVHWNEKVPLANPHKGWYHHYPDNHVNKYEIRDDDDLLKFPGMDHLYIRLAWAYLEPQEGRFDWPVIDRLIDKWVGHGLGISFRISCKETSTDRVEQQFATPKWVMEAGAKGGYYRNGQPVGPDGPWEPAFDDPVFLEKLENFLRAFAARYDGKPWLRYVDIGSIGDWGEGHTHSGSRKEYGCETRKQHVDLHLKYFKVSPLVISDDYVYSLSNLQQREALHRYIVEKGISYRDDSILVNGYLSGHAGTWTVRSPGFFADVWRQMPTVFELEHYGSVKRQGNWVAAPGSSLEKFGKGKSGADFFRGALGLLHATYIGYHGYAHEWFADNPALTVELLNRCGYWYFLHRVELPAALRVGEPCMIRMAWENRGVAPAYHAYVLRIRLEGLDTRDFELDSRNRGWMPDAVDPVHVEDYPFTIPADLKPGRYTVKAKLYAPAEKRDVLLALDPSICDAGNYYTLATDIALSARRD